MTDNSDFIHSQLQQLGLGATEARLYLAGLSFDRAVSASELQKATGLKRPTIYHNLDLLAAKGLASKVASQGHTNYAFSDPSQLERSVEAEVREARSKLQVVAQLARQLETIQPGSKGVAVKHFEGVTGVKTVVDMALFCKNPAWKVIAPIDNFFKQFDERYAKYYLVTRKRHGIKAKTLWEQPDPDGRALTKREIAERNPRFLPEALHGRFATTTILFDDKIALITSFQEQSAVLIESQEISDLFSVLFDGLWAVSKPYEDVVTALPSEDR